MVIGWGGAALLAWPAAQPTAPVSERDATQALRLALQRLSATALQELARPDGFFGDAEVRIGLPTALAQAERFLRAVGRGAQVDSLLLAMNRAAEATIGGIADTAQALARNLTLVDALQILRGGSTACTDWFSLRARSPLVDRLLPGVRQAVAGVEAAALYNRLAAPAAREGLLPADQASVEQWVTTRALDGLFVAMARRERQWRDNPAVAGEALLKRVFGLLR